MINLLSLFPADALQEAKLVADVENMLMNLSKDNYHQVFDKLKKSAFILSSQRIKQLANHIIFAVSKRYMSIPLYSKLTCDLYDLRSDENCLGELHSAFFPIIIPCNVDSRTLYFLYFCVVGSLFTMNDMVNVLRESLEKEPDHISELLTLFCFFAPEVEELDPKMFKHFINAVIEENKNKFCQSYIKQFGNEMHELCLNNWSLLKSRRESMKSGDKIIDSIFLDSVDEFQAITSYSSHFDFNQNINESIFSPPHMFSKTLIQFAARCGSVNCFKFLLFNNADLREAVESAIIGGSNEIVRILKQNNCDFKGSLSAAANSHRNAIFHWLESTYYPVCKNDPSNDAEALFGCVESCNIPLLLELLEKGIDINLKSNINEDVLSASINNPNDAFMLLVQHKDIDLLKSTDQYSPLSTAVDRRVFDAVNYFFHQTKFELSKTFQMDNLIFQAAFLGDEDIMRTILEYPKTNVNSVNKVLFNILYWSFFPIFISLL